MTLLIEFSKWFGETFEKCSDACFGLCVLRKESNQQIVEQAIRHFYGGRYELHIYVIMPNYVYALFRLFSDYKLASVLQSWDSFTVNEINRSWGASGTLWQSKLFDRLIRNEEHYQNVVNYIEAHIGGISRLPSNNEDGTSSPLVFSPAVSAVFDAGRDL